MKTIEMHIATATAHRACCSEEHDPANGKIHGFCVVCGVPWPCETAQVYLEMPPVYTKPIQAGPTIGSTDRAPWVIALGIAFLLGLIIWKPF